MTTKKVLCQIPLNDQQHRKLKMWAVYRNLEINEVLDEAIEFFIRLRRKNAPKRPLYILPLKGARNRSCWMKPESIELAKDIAKEDEVTIKAVMLMSAYEYLSTTDLKEISGIDEPE